MDLSSIIQTISENFPKVKDWFLSIINLAGSSGKVISLLVIAIIIYLAIKVSQPLIKIAIVILSIILLLQIGLSFL